MTPSSQKGGLEAVAVSRSFVSISFLIKILGFFITVSNVIFHKSHNKTDFASYITLFFITQLMTFISLLTHFISFCSHFHWLYHSFWQGSFSQHCHWGKVNINSLYYDEIRFGEIHGLVMKGWWDGTGIMLVHSGFFSGESCKHLCESAIKWFFCLPFFCSKVRSTALVLLSDMGWSKCCYSCICEGQWAYLLQ